MKKYQEIYLAIACMTRSYGLTVTEKFIENCIERVMDDADEDWNDDDVRIAIQNALNELIERDG